MPLDPIVIVRAKTRRKVTVSFAVAQSLVMSFTLAETAKSDGPFSRRSVVSRVAYSLHCPSRTHPNAVFLGILEEVNPLKTQCPSTDIVDYETVALAT
jgi:hypothetical protein